MYFGIGLKIAIMAISFYWIKNLPIPDSYKFLLTVIPSLLLISSRYVINSVQYSGKNKPITVRRDDNRSDIAMSEDFFFEKFSLEIQKDADATLYENEKPFWIENAGFLDISNPNNYIKLDNVHLTSNYTLEFWLRLKYLGNNNIISFYSGEQPIFDVSYDERFIYINQTTKVPYVRGQWFHFVIMRGKPEMLGGNRGLLYINGIFHSYIDYLPNLDQMNSSFLFKNTSPGDEYNKKYHDLSNCALVRFYDRSLTIDEIQNNYLKDASYFGLQEEDMSSTRTYVNGSSMVFYLDARVPKSTISEKVDESIQKKKEGQVDVMYNISKASNSPKEPSKVKVVEPKEEDIVDDVLLVGFAGSDKKDTKDSNNWLGKAQHVSEKEEHISKKTIKLPEKEMVLKSNWLDGTSKKSDGTSKETMVLKGMKESTADEDSEKESESDSDKKVKKTKQSKKAKNVKELKSSKPIF
jgi:hypothetical protein